MPDVIALDRERTRKRGARSTAMTIARRRGLLNVCKHGDLETCNDLKCRVRRERVIAVFSHPVSGGCA
jgi:hypothetical protein